MENLDINNQWNIGCCGNCEWHGHAGNQEVCNNQKSVENGHETNVQWTCDNQEDRV